MRTKMVSRALVIFIIVVLLGFLLLLLARAAPAETQEGEEFVQLIIEVSDGESKKEVKDAVVDLISKEEPEKFSLKSAKTDNKGVARFRIPPGKVVIQVNARDHDPKPQSHIINKDAKQLVKIVLEKRDN